MAKSEPYDVGDEVLNAITWVDDNDAPMNPATVELLLEAPSGTVTVYATGDLDHPAVGDYEKGHVVDESGLWEGEWRAPGLTIPFSFRVRESRFAFPYTP